MRKKYVPALAYHFLTNYYDFAMKISLPEKKIRTALIESVNPQKHEKILEFGFGTAQNLLLANQMNKKAQFEGLEIDSKVMEIAKKKLTKKNIKIPLFLYDGYEFPFENNYFDKIYSCMVFHLLDTETKLFCLNEMFRVLKKGGMLVIGDWGKPANFFLKMSFYSVQTLAGFKNSNDHAKGLITKFIERSGFQNVENSKSFNTWIGTFCYYKGFKL